MVLQLQNGVLFIRKTMLEFIFLYLFDLDNTTIGPSEEKVLGERTEMINILMKNA